MWLTNAANADESHYVFQVRLIHPPLDYHYGLVNFLIRKQNFIIDNISLNVGDETFYHIPELFREFGKPKGIYYYSYSRQGGYNIWFYLYYPDDGFIASYLTTFETNDWTLRNQEVCFQKTIYLSLWPKNSRIVFPSIILNVPEVDEFSIQHVVTIDQITQDTIEGFYNAQLENKGDVCINVSLKDS